MRRKEAFAGPERDGRLIMGRNCVAEVLRTRAGDIAEIFIAGEAQLDARGKDLASRARASGARIQSVTAGELHRLLGSDSHQSFAARIERSVTWPMWRASIFTASA